MRLFLNVLFVLAILPTTAKAAPFAEYNPATGDILFGGIRGLRVFSIYSKEKKLRGNILGETPIVSPANAALPIAKPAGPSSSPQPGVQWVVEWPPYYRRSFEFDSLLFPAAVPPGTPTSDLWGLFWVGDNPALKLEITTVPEPSTIALSGMSLLSLAALRRRK